MKARHARASAALALALASGASAQPAFNDPGFESGTLAQWIVANSPAGAGAPGGVFTTDIDGPGPLPASPAAGFQVGRTSASGVEGVDLVQSLSLDAGGIYFITFDWSSLWVGAIGANAEGGYFAVLDGGVPVSFQTCGLTDSLTPHYGRAQARVVAPAAGPRLLGARIARPNGVSVNLRQHADNFTIERCTPCQTQCPAFLNPGFEAGFFDGWTISPTPGGGEAHDVESIDIDGPGPLPVSPAARFNVFGPVGGEAGAELTQPVTLTAGNTYYIEYDWMAAYLSPPTSAGEPAFWTVVDGQPLNWARGARALTGTNGFVYGRVAGRVQPSVTRQYNIGARLTVNGTGSNLLFSFVDNFTITTCQPACYPNCDASTTAPILNVLDFNCFLNRFAAGASYANCDGSTIPPVLNVLDFNCFLNAFAAGCP
jgi:hypothetical protein